MLTECGRLLCHGRSLTVNNVHATSDDSPVLSRFTSPSKPNNATPDDLSVCSRIRVSKFGGCDDGLSESEWIPVGDGSGRNG